MKKFQALICIALPFFIASCATIVSGSKQTVRFTSNPLHATVFIDSFEVGKTPFESRITRSQTHTIVIKLDGYQNYELKMTRKFNGWYIGNLFFGGIIGLIVDPITGAIFNLSPAEVRAPLVKGAVTSQKKDSIYIAVSLTQNPDAIKVGQLTKEN
jgi:hypothetical protein